MHKIQRYQPNNSFNKRPIVSQIVAYLTMTLDILVFSICIIPNLQQISLKITISTLFMLSFATTILSGLLASCFDSSDRLLSSNIDGNPIKSIKENTHLYCQKCKSIVHQKSRHCKICNICVEEFDHHCIWLNTCIGKNNYISFMVLLFSIAINFMLYLAGLAVLWREAQWNMYFASMVVAWSASVVVVIIQMLILILLGFHLFLIKKGMTTFEYLVLRSPIKISPQINENKQKDCSMTKNNTFASFDNDPNNLNQEVVINYPHLKSFQPHQELNLKKQTEVEPETRKHLQTIQQKVQKIQEKQIESESNTEGEPQIRRNKSLSYILGGLQIQFPVQKQYGQNIESRKLKAKSSLQLRQNKEDKYRMFIHGKP